MRGHLYGELTCASGLSGVRSRHAYHDLVPLQQEIEPLQVSFRVFAAKTSPGTCRSRAPTKGVRGTLLPLLRPVRICMICCSSALFRLNQSALRPKTAVTGTRNEKTGDSWDCRSRAFEAPSLGNGSSPALSSHGIFATKPAKDQVPHVFEVSMQRRSVQRRCLCSQFTRN